MIHAYHYANPLAAHDGMCEQLVYGDTPGRDYDWTRGTELGLHNVSIFCDSIDFEFNLKRLWIPPSRWKMMIRQYIDPAWLDDCLDKIEERMAGPNYGTKSKGTGIAILRAGEHKVTDAELFAGLDDDLDGIEYFKTRMVQGKGVGRSVRRRWGSCMLNLSFRKLPVPTVSLHSRTTYFGYLAILDMAVARSFAYEAAAITDIPIGDIRFVWTIDLAQFHGFRSLAWALGDPDIHTDLLSEYPNRFDWAPGIKPGNQLGYRKCLDGLARIKKSDDAGTLYGDESFSSFARIRRRYHVEILGSAYSDQFKGGTRNGTGKGAFPPLPDTWVSSLDFSALGSGGGVVDDDDEDDD